jgi:hypothetical protein
VLPLLRVCKLAAALDLDVDTLPICHLCLFDVAMARARAAYAAFTN